ncbi:hypothetical protein HYPSUDRAFT_146829 [Hypholoma sublateritium FD-334 SS-4]|uniref:RNase H type-1 domain-containing protein n=1 Tax=Hypholoma sublateritium (strain FD-334 SS-4) TaxID=945553 RepID=A0A0D2NDL7_HYPSF|nr:hypothetical protein HYPSUDRAFT_146829 [Hypholoma sublateritium FD-334 SS-4]
MGFWDVERNLGFYAPASSFPNALPNLIFHFKALCVLSALHHICQKSSSKHRIIIHTNSSNMFDIFNSLRCQPTYNHILKSAVNLLISGAHNHRVLHIPGIQNCIADTLSRFDFARAESISHSIKIQSFQPPQVMMGPAKK